MPRTLLGILIFTLAIAPAAPASEGEAALAAYLRKYPSQVAYHAVRLADGAVLASRDAGTMMAPASVQKVCTTAVALEVLGGEFRFRTRLATAGDDVLILGDGDPIFGDPVVAKTDKRTIYHTLDAWSSMTTSSGSDDTDCGRPTSTPSGTAPRSAG